MDSGAVVVAQADHGQEGGIKAVTGAGGINFGGRVGGNGESFVAVKEQSTAGTVLDNDGAFLCLQQIADSILPALAEEEFQLATFCNKSTVLV